MRIRGAEDLTPADLAAALRAGGRLVFYEYCISLIFLTLRCPTDLYLLWPEESGVVPGLPYSVVSLLFGWWGIPMGMIYTPLTLFNNFCGGCDVTAEVQALLPQDGEKTDEPVRSAGPTE
jgi:hypothetical protein